MAQHTVKRTGTLLQNSGTMVAFDMIPVTEHDTDTFEYGLLYIEGGGIVAFKNTAGVLRSVTVPAFYVTPFAVNNLHTSSTVTGVHRMVVGYVDSGLELPIYGVN